MIEANRFLVRISSLLLGALFIVTFSTCKKDVPSLPEDRCEWLPDAGPCGADMTRYYYDQQEQKCKSFRWGGCQGVVPFETMEACLMCVDTVPPSGNGQNLFPDDYSQYDTEVKKYAFAFLKLTFPYLDEDGDISYEADYTSEFIDEHELGQDFLEPSAFQWILSQTAKEVAIQYRAYLKLIPSSGVYASEDFVRQLTSEEELLERVIMINHIQYAEQALVYDYLTNTAEFENVARWMNIYPTFSELYKYETGYALYDKRYSEELISVYNFSGAGAFDTKINAKHYDIMGYAYGDCIKTMGTSIVEHFLSDEALMNEITLLYHGDVLEMSEDVQSGFYTAEDFAGYLESNVSWGALQPTAYERIEEDGWIKLKAELEGNDGSKWVHAELRVKL